MYREIVDRLALWKDRVDRKPLLLTGAKGVGKTTVAAMFAESHYKKRIVFDLSEETGGFDFGETLNRHKFDEVILGYTQEKESKEDILLIFDHLNKKNVGKNSLEDIVKFIIRDLMDYDICLITDLDEKKLFSGGVLAWLDVYEVFPISLKEFFVINGNEELLLAVQNQMKCELSEQQREKLRQYVKVYFITGGMPEVLNTYMETRSLEKVGQARRKSFESYLSEIEKISDEKFRKKVLELFQNVAVQLDRKDKSFRCGFFRFSAGRREDEAAIAWLSDRKMLIKVEKYQTDTEKKRYKLYYNDIAMLTYAYGIQFQDLLPEQYPYGLRNHALFEMFILQQILVSDLDRHIYYWRDEAGTEDWFLCGDGKRMMPVRPDYGTGKEKALREYRRKYHPDLVVTVTGEEVEIDESAIKIPSYAVWNL